MTEGAQILEALKDIKAQLGRLEGANGQPDDGELWTAKQTAAYLGVNVRTFNHRLNQPALWNLVPLPGRYRKFLAADVIAARERELRNARQMYRM